MAREAAYVIRFGHPVPGREAKSLEVFMEFIGFWGQQAEAGRCTPPQVFLSYDGNNGMGIVTGQSDALFAISESPEWETLVNKGSMIVTDLRAEMYLTGDAIMQATQSYAAAGAALGYM